VVGLRRSDCFPDRAKEIGGGRWPVRCCACVDGVSQQRHAAVPRIWIHGRSLYGFGLVTAYGLWTRVPLRWISLADRTAAHSLSSTTVLDSIPRYLSTVCTAFPILAHAGIRWPMLAGKVRCCCWPCCRRSA
jgi:hypothetical protein